MPSQSLRWDVVNSPCFSMSVFSDSLYDVHKQETGVPQGSILSVTLFGLKINSACLNASVQGLMVLYYVDDFLICYRSKNMHAIERQMQHCLNRKLAGLPNVNGWDHFVTTHEGKM